MKVVLFCGGQGMRLREYSEQVPKPMVPLGDRPVLWHVMKYYAHYGHKEFILCLGYQGSAIKRFFLTYEEEVSNDFRLNQDGSRELFDSDIHDWQITFVDTGLHSPIGERLKRVEKYIGEDEFFLANYADGLSDLDLPVYLDRFMAKEAVASIMAIRPPQSYHALNLDEGSRLVDIQPMAESDIWLNGGFFAFRREVFDYIERGEELVAEPFARLAKEGKILVHKHEGFFAPMDTFKDKKNLEERYERDDAPWVVWKMNSL